MSYSPVCIFLQPPTLVIYSCLLFTFYSKYIVATLLLVAVNTSSVQSMKFTRHLISNSSLGVTVVVLHTPSVEHYPHHNFLPSTSLWHWLDLQRDRERGYQLTTLRVVIDTYEELVGSKAISKAIHIQWMIKDCRIQFRFYPTRATENPISIPDFSQQPMLHT